MHDPEKFVTNNRASVSHKIEYCAGAWPGWPCRIILVALASALTYLICLSCQYWSKTVTMKLKVGILVIKRLIGWLVLNLHFTIPCRDNVLCAGPLCRADFGLGNARTAINVNYHGIVHHNREALPIICLDVVPCGIVRVSTLHLPCAHAVRLLHSLSQPTSGIARRKISITLKIDGSFCPVLPSLKLIDGTYKSVAMNLHNNPYTRFRICLF